MCPCARVPFIPPFVLSLTCFCAPRPNISVSLCRAVQRHTERFRNTHMLPQKHSQHRDAAPPLTHSHKHSPMSGQTPDPCLGFLPPAEPCSGAPPRLAPTHQGLTRFSWERAGPKNDNSDPTGAEEGGWRGGLHTWMAFYSP